jgi:hypothetical protein
MTAVKWVSEFRAGIFSIAWPCAVVFIRRLRVRRYLSERDRGNREKVDVKDWTREATSSRSYRLPTREAEHEEGLGKLNFLQKIALSSLSANN